MVLAELLACQTRGRVLDRRYCGNVIYLDNAATTFPKPVSVLSRMVQIYLKKGVSPGRGSYDLTVEAEELVNRTRQKLARFFCAPDPNRYCQPNCVNFL